MVVLNTIAILSLSDPYIGDLNLVLIVFFKEPDRVHIQIKYAFSFI